MKNIRFSFAHFARVVDFELWRIILVSNKSDSSDHSTYSSDLVTFCGWVKASITKLGTPQTGWCYVGFLLRPSAKGATVLTGTAMCLQADLQTTCLHVPEATFAHHCSAANSIGALFGLEGCHEHFNRVSHYTFCVETAEGAESPCGVKVHLRACRTGATRMQTVCSPEVVEGRVRSYRKGVRG